MPARLVKFKSIHKDDVDEARLSAVAATMSTVTELCAVLEVYIIRCHAVHKKIKVMDVEVGSLAALLNYAVAELLKTCREQLPISAEPVVEPDAVVQPVVQLSVGRVVAASHRSDRGEHGLRESARQGHMTRFVRRVRDRRR